MRRSPGLAGLALLLALPAAAQSPGLSPTVKQFVRVDSGRVVLTHVRVIDGTGAAAVEDRNLVLEGGKIAAVQPGADLAAAAGATVLDLRGHTVMPGIVGMHNHLYYIARPNLDSGAKSEPPLVTPQMTFSAPRLYLAGGVTTMRTAGNIEPYTDLNLRRDIDAGKLPGPHLDVTAPYLEGAQSPFIGMLRLTSPEEARQHVEYWADRGATSFKAYMNLTRAQLKAAIDAAHKRGLKITGHLCAVTYPEAAALGIDDLEHGFEVNTQLDPGKKPDICSESAGQATLSQMQADGPAAKSLIQTLIAHHVALTSTLPVFESQAGPDRPPVRQAVLDVMSPQSRDAFFYVRTSRAAKRATDKIDRTALWKNELALERAFVAAGGLLMSGPDPTGGGDVVPGFSDQRGIELLVEAGFSPVEAIRIATLNGAIYLGRDKEIGSIAAGKNADLVVLRGDPSKQIADVENVELVFKDGVGFDSKKLIDSVKGRYGEY